MNSQWLVESVMGRCIHFTGTVNEFCAAGLKYDVLALPCFKTANSLDCFLEHFPDQTEAKAIVSQMPLFKLSTERSMDAHLDEPGTGDYQ